MTGKVTIMAMDTDQRTLNWIQQGLIAATIAQKPYTMAYFGAKVLDDLHWTCVQSWVVIDAEYEPTGGRCT
jgi:ABC-type sugar transport system substrate-binding protein